MALEVCELEKRSWMDIWEMIELEWGMMMGFPARVR